MRLFGALVLAALAACAPPSLARAATALVFSLTTTQGPTTVDSATGLHPSEVGETFVSSLALANAGSPQLGRRAWARVGTMRFSYTIRRQCTAFGPVCDATADFATVSALPGGTVVAGGKGISTAYQTITIPVIGGTGRYAGARGTVTISPSSRKVSVYRLELP
jgi:hypothetical protein